MLQPLTLRQLAAQPITPAAFAPFGQVIFAVTDDQPFGPGEARLQLDAGRPRLYIMALKNRGLRFRTITRHQRCTQCLGSLGDKDWVLGVAPPGAASEPTPETIRAFHIPGHCFIKLEVGTWHAGPYFSHDAVSFYNLELSNTNLTDHHTCDLGRAFGLEFEIRLNEHHSPSDHGP
ncbi:MAG: ureidoglycolate lyase [Nodosilinea sp.]